MDQETAGKIREAFGDCTTVYECMTIEDIVADAQDRALTPAQWIKLQLDVEGIRADRDDCYEEWRGMEREIRARLKEAGLKVACFVR